MMGCWKASFARNMSSNESKSKLSAREYWNERVQKVDKDYKSTELYADTTDKQIDRMEGLWREYAAIVISLTLDPLTFLVV